MTKHDCEWILHVKVMTRTQHSSTGANSLKMIVLGTEMERIFDDLVLMATSDLFAMVTPRPVRFRTQILSFC